MSSSSSSWKQVGGINNIPTQVDVRHKSVTTTNLAVLGEVNSDLSGNFNLNCRKVKITDPNSGIIFGDGSILSYSPFDYDGNFAVRNDIYIYGTSYLIGPVVHDAPISVNSDLSINGVLQFNNGTDNGNYFFGNPTGIGLNKMNPQYTLDISGSTPKVLRVATDASSSRNIIASDGSFNQMVIGTSNGTGYIDFFTGNSASESFNNSELMGAGRISVVEGPGDSQGTMILDASRINISGQMTVNPRIGENVIFTNPNGATSLFYDSLKTQDSESYMSSPTTENYIGTSIAGVAQNEYSNTYMLLQSGNGDGFAIGGGYNSLSNATSSPTGSQSEQSSRGTLALINRTTNEYSPVVSMVQDPDSRFNGFLGINNTNPTVSLDVNGYTQLTANLVKQKYASETDIPLNDIAMATDDPQVGYIVGNLQTLLKTTDGGQSWTKITPVFPQGQITGTPDFLKIAVSPTNSNYAIIVPNQLNSIYLTTNGGANWSILNPDGSQLLSNVNSNNRVTSILIDSNTNIYGTTNQIEGTTKNYYVQNESSKSILQSNFRMVRSGQLDIGNTLYTYSTVYIPTGTSEKWFLSAGDATHYGQIYSTVSGLQIPVNTNLISTPLYVSYTAMVMSDANNGVIVGDNSTILRKLASTGQWQIVSTRTGTSPMGAIPKISIMGTGTDIENVTFNDVKMCPNTSGQKIVAVGTSGAIIYSLDGGVTWTNFWAIPANLNSTSNRAAALRQSNLTRIFIKDSSNFIFTTQEGEVYDCFFPQMFDVHATPIIKVLGDMRTEGDHLLNGKLNTDLTTFYIANTAAKQIYMGSDASSIVMAGKGSVTHFQGQVDVQGGSINTPNTTFSLLDNSALTITMGSSATTMSLGKSSVGSIVNMNNQLNVVGNTLSTSTTGAFNLINTNVASVNFARSANNIIMGAPNTSVVTTGGNLQVGGTSLSSTSTPDFALISTADTSGTLTIGGYAKTVRLGRNTGTTLTDTRTVVYSSILEISGSSLTTPNPGTFSLLDNSVNIITFGTGTATNITMGANQPGASVHLGGTLLNFQNTANTSITSNTTGTFSIVDTNVSSVSLGKQATTTTIGSDVADSRMYLRGQVDISGSALTTPNQGTFSLLDTNIKGLTLGKSATNIIVGAASSGNANNALVQINANLDISGGTKLSANAPTFSLLDASVSMLTLGLQATTIQMGSQVAGSRVYMGGALELSGASIGTTQQSFSLLDLNAQTISMGQSASNIAMGNGATAANTKIYLRGQVDISGTALTTQSKTFSILDTNVNTLSMGGNATSIKIGPTGGANNTNAKMTLGSGTVEISGNRLTTTAQTFSLLDTSATTITMGQSANTIVMGLNDPTTTTKIVMRGQVDISGAITSVNPTFNLLNDASLINMGLNAQTINIGDNSVSSKVAVNGTLDIATAITTPNTSGVFTILNNMASSGEVQIATNTNTIRMGKSTSSIVIVNNNLQVLGQNVITSQSTMNLFNTNLATLNMAGTASTVNISTSTINPTTLNLGSSTNYAGYANVNSNLKVRGTIIDSSSASMTFLNNNVNTMRMLGDTTDLTIGSASTANAIYRINPGPSSTTYIGGLDANSNITLQAGTNGGLNVTGGGPVLLSGSSLSSSSNTMNLFGQSASVYVGSNTGTTYIPGYLSVSGGFVGSSGIFRFDGSVDISGGITSTRNPTFRLVDGSVNTLYFARDASTIIMGSPQVNSTVTIQGKLDVSGGIQTTQGRAIKVYNDLDISTNIINSSATGNTVASIFDSKVGTIYIGGDASSIILGSTLPRSSVGIRNTLNVLGGIQNSSGAGNNAIFIYNPIDVSGDITSISTTSPVSIMNTNVKQLNIGGDASSIFIGSGQVGATTKLRTKLDVSGGIMVSPVGGVVQTLNIYNPVDISGGTLSTKNLSASVFDASATTASIFSAATSITMGSGQVGATTTLRTKLDVSGGIMVSPVGGAVQTLNIYNPVDISGNVTTRNSSVSVFDNNATTASIFSSATSITMGSGQVGATTKLHSKLDVSGGIMVSPVGGAVQTLNIYNPVDISGNLSTQNNTMQLFNSNVGTLLMAGDASSITIGANLPRSITRLNTGLDVSGGIKKSNIAGVPAEQIIYIYNPVDISGALSSSSPTFNLLNGGGVRTINMGGDASSIYLGSSSDPTQTTVYSRGGIDVASGKITSNNSVANIFPTGVSTINMGLSGDSIFIGNSASNVYFNGNIFVNGTTTTGGFSTSVNVQNSVIQGDFYLQSKLNFDSSQNPVYFNSYLPTVNMFNQPAYTTSKGTIINNASTPTYINLGRDVAGSYLNLGGDLYMKNYDISGAGYRIYGRTGDVSINAITVGGKAIFKQVPSLASYTAPVNDADLVSKYYVDTNGGTLLLQASSNNVWNSKNQFIYDLSAKSLTVPIDGSMTILGREVVTDSSINHLSVTGNMFAQDISVNQLTVKGTAIFTNAPISATVPVGVSDVVNKLYVDNYLSEGSTRNNVWTTKNQFLYDLSAKSLIVPVDGSMTILGREVVTDSSINHLSVTGNMFAQDISVNQLTVKGTAIFTNAPISSTVPVGDSDVVNKLYVDNYVTAGSSRNNVWTTKNQFLYDLSAKHLVVPVDGSMAVLGSAYIADVSINNLTLTGKSSIPDLSAVNLSVSNSAIFTNAPISASVPVEDSDVVNKLYVDNYVTAGSSRNNVWTTKNQFLYDLSAKHLVVPVDGSMAVLGSAYIADASINNLTLTGKSSIPDLSAVNLSVSNSAIFTNAPVSASVPVGNSDVVNKLYVDNYVTAGSSRNNVWTTKNQFLYDLSAKHLVVPVDGSMAVLGSAYIADASINNLTLTGKSSIPDLSAVNLSVSNSAIFTKAPVSASVPVGNSDVVNKLYVDNYVTAGSSRNNVWTTKNQFLYDLSAKSLTVPVDGSMSVLGTAYIVDTSGTNMSISNNLYVNTKMVIGNNNILTGSATSGKMKIYEQDIGTLATELKGSLVMEHDASGGVSSIVMPSRFLSGQANYSSFGMVQYSDCSNNGLIIGLQGQSTDALKIMQIKGLGTIYSGLVCLLTGNNTTVDAVSNFTSSVTATNIVTKSMGKASVFDFTSNNGSGAAISNVSLGTLSTYSSSSNVTTIMFWCMPTKQTGLTSMQPININDTTTAKIQIQINANGSVSVITNNGANTITTSSTGLISINQWNQVVVTLTAGINGTYKIYVNGVLRPWTGTAYTGTFAYNTITVGTNAGNTSSFCGYMADIQLYSSSTSANGLLDATTVATLYSQWANMGNNIILKTPQNYGNVGINTENPLYTLDVSGTMNISNYAILSKSPTVSDSSYVTNVDFVKGYVYNQISGISSNAYNQVMTNNNTFTGLNTFQSDISAQNIRLTNGSVQLLSTGKVVGTDASFSNTGYFAQGVYNGTNTIGSANNQLTTKYYVDNLISTIVLGGGSVNAYAANVFTNNNYFTDKIITTDIDISGTLTGTANDGVVWTISPVGDISANAVSLTGPLTLNNKLAYQFNQSGAFFTATPGTNYIRTTYNPFSRSITNTGYTYFIFTNTGASTFTIAPVGGNATLPIHYVVISGGQGGKSGTSGNGGGGGAGGIVSIGSTSISVSKTFTVTVGAGGVGGNSPTTGGTSSLAASGFSTVTSAISGGTLPTLAVAGSNGSGSYGSGGAPGTTATAGSNGYVVNFPDGVSVHFAGGGGSGGTNDSTSAAGGLYGGGTGGATTPAINAQNLVINNLSLSQGGGGGGSSGAGSTAGGNGGNGIVILVVPNNKNYIQFSPQTDASRNASVQTSAFVGIMDSNTVAGINSLQAINYSNTSVPVMNTVVGQSAANSLVDGSKNTFLGAFSNVASSATTYIQSTAIGYGSVIDISNQIKMGTSTELISIPGQTIVGPYIPGTTIFGPFSASNTPDYKMMIYENNAGTPASLKGGSLLITHDGNGQSSIVFPTGLKGRSDYGYIQYNDNAGVSSTADTEKAKLVIGIENNESNDASGPDSIVFATPANRGYIGINIMDPSAQLDISGSVIIRHGGRLDMSGAIVQSGPASGTITQNKFNSSYFYSDVSFAGKTVFLNDISTNGGAYFDGPFNVQSTGTYQSVINIGTGASRTSNINIGSGTSSSGNVTIGPLNSAAFTTIQSDLVVLFDVSMNRNLTVDGDINLQTTISGGTMNIGTSTSRKNDINIGSTSTTSAVNINNISVKGYKIYLPINGGIFGVTSNSVMVLGGNISSGSISVGNDLTTGNIYIGTKGTSGTISLGTSSDRSGLISIGTGSTIAGADVIIGGASNSLSTTVNSKLVPLNDISSSIFYVTASKGDVSANNLSVDGSIYVKGNLNLLSGAKFVATGDISSSVFYVNASKGDVSANNLSVMGATYATGDVNIQTTNNAAINIGTWASRSSAINIGSTGSTGSVLLNNVIAVKGSGQTIDAVTATSDTSLFASTTSGIISIGGSASRSAAINIGIGSASTNATVTVGGSKLVSLNDASFNGNLSLAQGKTITFVSSDTQKTQSNPFIGKQDTTNFNLRVGQSNSVTGTNNTMVGVGTGYSIDSNSNNNTSVGAWSLYALTKGLGNTAIGQGALYNDVSGSDNTALGNNAGIVNYYGNRNTFLGTLADLNFDNSGIIVNDSTAIGYGTKITASNQIVIGRSTETVNIAGKLFPTGDISSTVFYVTASRGDVSANNLSLVGSLQVKNSNQSNIISNKTLFSNDVSLNGDFALTSGNASINRNLVVNSNVTYISARNNTSFAPTVIPNITLFNDFNNSNIGSYYPKPDGALMFASTGSDLSVPSVMYMGIVKDQASYSFNSQRLDIGTAQSLSNEFITGTNTFNNPIATFRWNGRVGINNTDPSTYLDVNGGTLIRSNLDVCGNTTITEITGTDATATGGSLTLKHNNSGGTSSIVFTSAVSPGNDYAYIKYKDNTGSGENGKLIIGVENDPGTQDNIILNAANYRGYVGINTLNPSTHLDVSGSALINSNLTVSGTSSLSDVSINNLNVATNAYIGNFTVNGSTITATNAATTSIGSGVSTNTLSIGNDITTGTLNLASSISSTGTVNIGQLYLKGQNIYSDTVTTASSLFDNNTSGIISIGGSASRSAAINIGTGSTSTNATVTVGGSKLVSLNDASFNGNLSLAQGKTITFVGSGTQSNPFIGKQDITNGSLRVGTSNTIVGGNNTVVGVGAGNAIQSTANYNTAIGGWSLSSLTTGAGNTAVGLQALALDVSGNDNTAIGNNAGVNNKYGNRNTFLGTAADLDNSGIFVNESIAIGYGTKIFNSNQIVLGRSTETVNIAGKLFPTGDISSTVFYVTASRGDVSANNLSVDGSIYVKDDLNILSGSKLVAVGDISSSSVFYVNASKGDVSANNLSVNGSSYLKGDLNLLSGAKLVALGDISSSVFYVNASKGDVSANNLSVDGSIYVKSNLTSSSGLTIKGDVYIQSDVSSGAINIGTGAGRMSTASINIGSDTNLGSVNINGLSIKGLNITTNASGSNVGLFPNLTSGNITIGGAVTSSVIAIGGSASRSGAINIGSGASATGAVNIGGSTTAGANVVIGGNSNTTTYTAVQSRLFTLNDVSMNAKLFVNNDVSLNAKLTVVGDASFNSELSVKGDLYIQPDVNGTINIGTWASRTSNINVGAFVLTGGTSQNITTTSVSTATNLFNNLTTGALTIGTSAQTLNIANAATTAGSTVTIGTQNTNFTVMKNKSVFVSDVSFASGVTIDASATNMTIANITSGGDFKCRNISMTGNLTSIGSASFQQTLGVTGYTTLSSNTGIGTSAIAAYMLNVNGKLNVAGTGTNFNIDGTTGDLSTNKLQVTDIMTARSNSYFLGDASFNGNFFNVQPTNTSGLINIGTAASRTSNINIGSGTGNTGIIYLNGVNVKGASLNATDISTNNLSITNTAQFIGDVSMNSSLTVASNSYHVGKTVMIGDVSLNSALTAVGKSTFLNDVSMNSSLTVASNSYLVGKTTMIGDVSLNSALTAVGKSTFLNDVSMNSSLTVASNSYHVGKTVMIGDVSLNSVLTAVGKSTFLNDVSMNSSLTVASNSYLVGKSVLVGDVSLNSSVSVGNNLTVVNNANLGNFTVNGSTITATNAATTSIGSGVSTNTLNIGNDITTGTLNLANFVTTGTVNIGQLNIKGQNIYSDTITTAASIYDNNTTGNITMGGAITSGIITIGGTSNRSGAINIGSGATATGAVNIGGSTTAGANVVIGGASNSVFTTVQSKCVALNDVSMNSKMVIGGDVSMNSAMTVTSNTYHVGKTYMFSDVSVNGGTFAASGKVMLGAVSGFPAGGQVMIYEGTGTDATANYGSLTIKHGNSGGASSIVFPSTVDAGVDYGYIKYQENGGGGGGTNAGRLVIGVENDPSGAGLNMDCIILNANSYQGFVGINTNSPAYHLDVSGIANISQTCRATNFNATSDYRIKENVVPLLPVSNVLEALKPVSYLNKLSGKKDIGLIAHEVADVLPELVEGTKDMSGAYQTINYIGLIPVLIKEIQKLQQEIATIKQKIG